MRTSQQVPLLVGSYILNFPAVGWHSQHKYILNSGQFGDNLLKISLEMLEQAGTKLCI